MATAGAEAVETEGYHAEWLALEAALGTRPALSGDQAQDIVVYNVMGEQLAAQWPKLDDGVLDVVNETIAPVGTVPAMKVRVYQPKGQGNDLPVMVYFHGGGYLTGNLETEDPHCRLLAAGVPCVVVSVEYPLAPGYNLSQIISAGVEAVNWTRSNAFRFYADKTHCLIGGGSAGAALAVQVGYDFVRRGDMHAVAGLVLFNPFAAPLTHYSGKYKELHTSYVENGAGVPFISTKICEDMHVTTKADFTSAAHFPLLATDFRNFPPTYIVTAEKDPVRDDGTVLHAVLKDAGVRVMLDSYRGFPHYFHIFPSVPTAHLAMQKAIAGTKFVLGHAG